MAKYVSKAKRLEHIATGYVPKAPNSVLLEEHRDLELQLDIEAIGIALGHAPPPPPPLKEPEPPASDISVDKLIGKGLIIIDREIRNLMSLSSSGKLESTDARDLRDTVKLLFELKERESNSLSSLSDEELAVRAKEVLNDGQ